MHRNYRNKRKDNSSILVEFVLNDNNIKAKACGNIGKSLSSLAFLEDEEAVLVIELSSFQLESLNKKVLDYAVILNITADHLLWHGSFDKYIKAKLNILRLLKKTGKGFVSQETANLHLKEKEIGIFDREILFLDKNIQAAYTILKNLVLIEKNWKKVHKNFKS